MKNVIFIILLILVITWLIAWGLFLFKQVLIFDYLRLIVLILIFGCVALLYIFTQRA